jgi:rhodanese-related sulfurtransferase
MKSFSLAIVFSLIMFGTSAFAEVKTPGQIVSDAKAKASHITVDALKKKIGSKEKFLLIDVRTEKEYLAGHIPGAVWVSRGMLEFKVSGINNDPKADIIVYCRSGARGSLSMIALKGIGYENVRDLDGGFKSWVTSGNSAYNMHGEIKVINFGKKETD